MITTVNPQQPSANGRICVYLTLKPKIIKCFHFFDLKLNCFLLLQLQLLVFLLNMSGDKCVYFDCNLTRRSSKNIFHPFPANTELHKQWIVNSGKYSYT